MIQRSRGLRAIAIGVVLVILALLIALFLLLRGGSKSGSTTVSATPTAIPSGSVVVAAYSIPQGTVFTSGQTLTPYFVVETEPLNLIPFGAYTSLSQVSDFINSTSCGNAKAASCVGRATTAQTIYAGEPVVSGMISALGEFRTAAGASFQIPYGYVAIGIAFSNINSVVNSIEPGDDVDLLASYIGNQKHYFSGVPSQTQYVLNDLRVLSINGPPAQPVVAGAQPTSVAAPGAPAPTPAPPPTPQPSGGTLIVLVRYQQALIIQHLKDFSNFWSTSVVLRSAKETDIPHFRTVPVTARWFFVKQANHFDLTNPY